MELAGHKAACLALSALLGAVPLCEGAEAEPDFTKDIRPILEKHCYECHNDKKHKGDLDLTAFDCLEKIHAAQETWQTILERVQAFEMPPEGKNELSFDKQGKLVR